MIERSSWFLGALVLLAAAGGCGSGAASGSQSAGGAATDSGAQGGDGTATGSETQGGGAAGFGTTSSTGGNGGSGGGSISSTGGNGGSSGGSTGAHATFPVAPDATHFMWQGMQTLFLDENQHPCTGSVAIAAGDQAVCYAAADDSLMCAGKIYDQVLGPAFTVVAGAEKVEQILHSPTFSAANHNSICVLGAGGPACMGGDDDWGQFGGGDESPASMFVPWGQISGVTALATGTWDQICAATSGAGQAFCSGYGFGPSPAQVAQSAASLWVDPLGMVQVNDATVLRASNGRTGCQVTAQGLSCDVGSMGQPGKVVDGTYTPKLDAPGMPPGKSRYCWLSNEGVVTCGIYDSFMPGPPTITTPFAQHPVLALAGNPYTTSLCAVYNDGSIACTGANDQGQLGLAASAHVENETIVQPPGSIKLDCK